MLDILVIGLIIAPVILISILEVNSIFAYFALCLGAVLSVSLNNNVYVLRFIHASNYIQHINYLNNLKLVFLILPLLLVMILMIKTAKGGGLFSLNILGSIATGFLLIYFIIPVLPASLTSGINTNPLWTKILSWQSNAIGISAIVILAMLIIQRGKLSNKSSKSKYKK